MASGRGRRVRPSQPGPTRPTAKRRRQGHLHRTLSARLRRPHGSPSSLRAALVAYASVLGRVSRIGGCLLVAVYSGYLVFTLQRKHSPHDPLDLRISPADPPAPITLPNIPAASEAILEVASCQCNHQAATRAALLAPPGRAPQLPETSRERRSGPDRLSATGRPSPTHKGRQPRRIL
jgi:hypothetical protein